jgi:hypothetical protein
LVRKGINYQYAKMTKQITNITLLSAAIFIGLTNCTQPTKSNDYLISFVDTVKDEYGYRNQNGDTIIPLGKYGICYTDTFRTYAIVLKPSHGFVAIDKQENVLYEVFPFDNGPDYTSDGFFRIIKNNKIGFADSTTGKVIIKPLFDCAFPFENGLAKVSINCIEQPEGEHKRWISENWYYIDKSGNKISK